MSGCCTTPRDTVGQLNSIVMLMPLVVAQLYDTLWPAALGARVRHQMHIKCILAAGIDSDMATRVRTR